MRRACGVPAGRPLIGPAVNYWTWTSAECADLVGRTTGGEVTLDGAPVSVPKADPTPITIKAAAANPVIGEAGEFEAYGCGLWFTVPPPPPGEHVPRIRTYSATFSIAVNYERTVDAGV